jgi:uncharacterized protein YqjF (DUF2071 family)
MREWVPNPVSPFLVAPAYGLPQRPAQVHYEHDRAAGLFFGHVTARGLQLTMSARIDYGAPLEVPTSGSLDDFLMERYSGFQTPPWGRARFRIWHVPWPQRRIEGEIQQDALLRSTGGWYETARLATANFSPGVDGVEIGWPLPA